MLNIQDWLSHYQFELNPFENFKDDSDETLVADEEEVKVGKVVQNTIKDGDLKIPDVPIVASCDENGGNSKMPILPETA